MEKKLSPKLFADRVGISAPYASMILRGLRPATSDIALAAFRHFGLRLGLLAEMTDEDIAKLCDERCHTPANTPAPAALSSGFDVVLSTQSQAQEVTA